MISPSVTPLRHWDSNSKGIAMDIGHQMARSQDVATKVAVLFKKRTQIAQEQFTEQLKKAYDANGVAELMTNPAAGVKLWSDWYAYAADAAQRSILFWDTIRQRGNNFPMILPWKAEYGDRPQRGRFCMPSTSSPGGCCANSRSTGIRPGRR